MMLRARPWIEATGSTNASTTAETVLTSDWIIGVIESTNASTTAETALMIAWIVVQTALPQTVMNGAPNVSTVEAIALIDDWIVVEIALIVAWIEKAIASTDD